MPGLPGLASAGEALGRGVGPPAPACLTAAARPA